LSFSKTNAQGFMSVDVSGLATGTPIYSVAGLATGTPIYSVAGLATGTPIYSVDGLATGTPLYVETGTGTLVAASLTGFAVNGQNITGRWFAVGNTNSGGSFCIGWVSKRVYWVR
jgi:hypothetical protein